MSWNKKRYFKLLFNDFYDWHKSVFLEENTLHLSLLKGLQIIELNWAQNSHSLFQFFSFGFKVACFVLLALLVLTNSLHLLYFQDN